MPDKEDFELPKQNIPDLAIPDLKKKRDKERKKSGVAWGGGKAPGASLSGARTAEGAAFGGRVGAGAAESGAALEAGSGAGAAGSVGAGSVAGAAGSAAEGAGFAAEGAGFAAEGSGFAAESAGSAAGAAGSSAEAGAGLLGRVAGAFSNVSASIGNGISGLTSTAMGKTAALLTAALVVGGLAALIVKMMGHKGQADMAPNLGGISSSLKVDRDGSGSSLPYGAGKDMNWGDKPAESAKSGPEAAKSEVTKIADGDVTEQKPEDQAANVGFPKLSGSLGSDFGSGNPGSGGFGGGMPRFGSDSGHLSQFAYPHITGKALGGHLTAGMHGASSKFSFRGLRSSKSLASLRGMAPFNAQMRAGGSASATESNAAAGNSQFDGGAVTGATDPSGSGSAPGSVPGAPGTTPGTTPDTTPGITPGTIPGTTPGTVPVIPGVNPYVPTIEKCNYDSGEYWDGTACVSALVPASKIAQKEPWDGYVDWAKKLLLAGAIALATATALVYAAMTTVWFPPAAAALMAHAAIICAGVSAVMGAGVIYLAHQMGQAGAGGLMEKLYMAGGASLGAGAIAVMIGGGALWAAGAAVLFTGLLSAMNFSGLINPPPTNTPTISTTTATSNATGASSQPQQK